MSYKMSTSTPLFKITDQAPRIDYDDRGKENKLWRVRFQTPSGIESWIDIPDAEYTAQNVATRVTDDVRKIESIHALTGPAYDETSPDAGAGA